MVDINEVAIPSYSEVLFLLFQAVGNFKSSGRNPFLFRGPIPTVAFSIITALFKVAIPSYSEVLFLLEGAILPDPGDVSKVAIPSYSEVLFLPRAFITPLFST